MVSGAQVLLGKQWDSPSQSFLNLLTPQKYYIIILDLKDWFFFIALNLIIRNVLHSLFLP